MTAAQLIQAHPEVVAPLRDGRLCLTTVVELSKALAAAPGGDVLPRFFRASKREAKVLVAELAPAPAFPLRAVVTPVRSSVPLTVAPVGHAAPVLAAGSPELGDCTTDLGQPVGWPTSRGPTSVASPPVFVEEPKTSELSRIHVTVPRRLVQKLEAAKAAVSHSHPGASEDVILELGLDLILQRHAKRRGLVEKPRAPKAKAIAAAVESAVPAPAPTAGSSVPSQRRAASVPRREPIPAHVKRAVWRRDEGRCQWPVDAGGGVCGSTLRLEIDHVLPVALGGRPTVENLRCLCAAHNERAAREVFGDAQVDRFKRGGAPAVT